MTDSAQKKIGQLKTAAPPAPPILIQIQIQVAQPTRNSSLRGLVRSMFETDLYFLQTRGPRPKKGAAFSAWAT